MLRCPGVRNERHPGDVRHHQLAVRAVPPSHVRLLSTRDLHCDLAQDDLPPGPRT